MDKGQGSHKLVYEAKKVKQILKRYDCYKSCSPVLNDLYVILGLLERYFAKDQTITFIKIKIILSPDYVAFVV